MANVTASRGRTANKSTSFNVLAYGSPWFAGVQAYRCNSSGTRDDIAGTCARIQANFGRSTLNGNNTVTWRVTLSQVGSSYFTSSAMTSGSLAEDAAYMATLTLTDTVGTFSTYSAVVFLPRPISCT